MLIPLCCKNYAKICSRGKEVNNVDVKIVGGYFDVNVSARHRARNVLIRHHQHLALFLSMTIFVDVYLDSRNICTWIWGNTILQSASPNN